MPGEKQCTISFVLVVLFWVLLFGFVFGFALWFFGLFVLLSAFSSVDYAHDITMTTTLLAREASTSVPASFALISTTSESLYNDLAEAIEALEQKKTSSVPS